MDIREEELRRPRVNLAERYQAVNGGGCDEVGRRVKCIG